MPRATYYYEKEDKRFYRNLLSYSFNITFFIAIPAIATMATMSSSIVSLVAGANESSYTGAGLVLIILAAMMLTFSIADNIYTEILLPQKREKAYLFSMLLGLVLNIGLSLLLGGLAFKEQPIIGVAIATMVSDAIVLFVLLFLTRDYALKAIFTLNNLKILLLGLIIGAASYFLYPLLHDAMPLSEAWAKELISLVLVVLIDALVYIFGLLLCKEKLVSSFLPSYRRRMEALDAQSESEGK